MLLVAQPRRAGVPVITNELSGSSCRTSVFVLRKSWMIGAAHGCSFGGSQRKRSLYSYPHLCMSKERGCMRKTIGNHFESLSNLLAFEIDGILVCKDVTKGANHNLIFRGSLELQC